jgi:hypothetical protein
MKGDDNPMDRPIMDRPNAAPRCTAHSKRSGLTCQAPAVTGWTVCHFHGAGGGHRAGPSHPTWRHGMRSRAAVEMRKQANEAVREVRRIAALIG